MSKTFGDKLIDGMSEGLSELKKNEPMPMDLHPYLPKSPPFLRGDQIKEIRADYGFTQKEFSKMVMVSTRTIQSWEQGRTKPSGSANRLLQILNTPEVLNSIVRLRSERKRRQENVLKANVRLDILDSYANEFREIINTVVWTGKKSLRESVRLSWDKDWRFLCASMDLIEDASGAISHFLRFGLDGPTKYVNDGEQYLRLYGILSAAYSQQQAFLKLCQLMNYGNWTELESLFEKNIKIRDLRHKLVAHGINYKDGEGKIVDPFITTRIDLNGYECTCTSMKINDSERINLVDLICEHCECLITEMDGLCEKVIGTVFRPYEKKLKEYMKRLENIRLRRKGYIHQENESFKYVINLGF